MGPGRIPVLQTRYRAGQYIINEGEAVTGLHVLCDEWATVAKSVGMEQDDLTIHIVGAGGGCWTSAITWPHSLHTPAP